MEQKLLSWIGIMLILNVNMNFELKERLLNQNKQKLNFATYRAL